MPGIGGGKEAVISPIRADWLSNTPVRPIKYNLYLVKV